MAGYSVGQWVSRSVKQVTIETNFTKSFCGGPGGGFLEKSPLAAGGINSYNPLRRHEKVTESVINL